MKSYINNFLYAQQKYSLGNFCVCRGNNRQENQRRKRRKKERRRKERERRRGLRPNKTIYFFLHTFTTLRRKICKFL